MFFSLSLFYTTSGFAHAHLILQGCMQQGKAAGDGDPPAKRARTNQTRGQASVSSPSVSDARLEADMQQVSCCATVASPIPEPGSLPYCGCGMESQPSR